MKEYSTDFIRNVALVGHSGAGKTSLTEAFLFNTGVITRLGRVEDGTTVADFEDEEQRRQQNPHRVPAAQYYQSHCHEPSSRCHLLRKGPNLRQHQRRAGQPRQHPARDDRRDTVQRRSHTCSARSAPVLARGPEFEARPGAEQEPPRGRNQSERDVSGYRLTEERFAQQWKL